TAGSTGARPAPARTAFGSHADLSYEFLATAPVVERDRAGRSHVQRFGAARERDRRDLGTGRDNVGGQAPALRAEDECRPGAELHIGQRATAVCDERDPAARRLVERTERNAEDPAR